MSTLATPPHHPAPSLHDGDMAAAVAVFAELTPRLHGIAHRIVGNRAEAEDIVQDAWVRWQTCERANVQNPTAFLVTVTTRLAINAVKSARARHEFAVGDGLPEAIDTSQDPTVGPERHEALDAGVQHLLDHLAPNERAAFVLRQAFGYPYERLARTLDLTEANTRQLVSRAHKRLASARTRRADHADRGRLTAAIHLAAEHGDLHPLEQALVA